MIISKLIRNFFRRGRTESVRFAREAQADERFEKALAAYAKGEDGVSIEDVIALRDHPHRWHMAP